MIIDISVAVIAFAFVVLVIYLIVLMKALRVTMSQVNQTLVEARKQLSEIGGQAQEAAEHANRVSADIKEKAAALNPIFNAVANIGEVLEYKSLAFKKEAFTSMDEEGLDEKKKTSDKRVITVAAILELAGLGLSLWQKTKKRR